MTAGRAKTLPEFDLSDPNLYAEGNPHAIWKWLRNNAPVYWHPQRSGPGYWVVSKHEDVRAVARDAARFISSGGTSTRDLEIKVTLEAVLQELPGLEPAGEPKRLRSNILAGYEHLPVRSA